MDIIFGHSQSLMTEEVKGLFWLDDVEDKEEDINSVLVLVAPIIYSWRGGAGGG